jgi:CspA family cold shock protein
MTKKINGVVVQFGTKGYGFIVGDDEVKYFVHQKNVFNKSRLKTKTRVIFSPEESEKGFVATNVELEDRSKMPKISKDLSGGFVKLALTVLFIAQAAIIYKVFFAGVIG